MNQTNNNNNIICGYNQSQLQNALATIQQQLQQDGLTVALTDQFYNNVVYVVNQINQLNNEKIQCLNNSINGGICTPTNNYANMITTEQLTNINIILDKYLPQLKTVYITLKNNISNLQTVCGNDPQKAVIINNILDKLGSLFGSECPICTPCPPCTTQQCTECQKPITGNLMIEYTVFGSFLSCSCIIIIILFVLYMNKK